MTTPITMRGRELTALEAGALRAALVRLMDPTKYFDICAFDQMVKVYEATPDCRDYNALRLLHCVNWRDMDRTTQREAQAAVFRTFTPDNQTAEAFVDAFREPTPQKVSTLRRLFGGASA